MSAKCIDLTDPRTEAILREAVANEARPLTERASAALVLLSDGDPLNPVTFAAVAAVIDATEAEVAAALVACVDQAQMAGL